MRILIANDDGIHAPGLKVLERIAHTLSDDVWVVAPETEQSGAGHSLTMHTPLRLRRLEEKRFAVNGTPTDCVLLGVQVAMEGTLPDLLLSGVNSGANLGEDITYSGTVAAAMEGTLLGIPSIALSQMHRGDRTQMRFDAAEAYGAQVITALLNEGWPKGILMNVNFPALAPAEIKGIRATPQGKRKLGLGIVTNADPEGKPYYWISGWRDETYEHPETDLAAIRAGYVSVTPLSMDLSDYKTLSHLQQVLPRAT